LELETALEGNFVGELILKCDYTVRGPKKELI
jgi:hypothetical protein